MKTTLLVFMFGLASISAIQAQDYQIDFTGTGESTVVDEVKVENLTQCTSIDMSGNDILHLVAFIGLDELNSETNHKILAYPNPMIDHCVFEFEATATGNVTIGLYDLTGKKIQQVRDLLAKGHHRYQLSGVSSGFYTLKVESETYCYKTKIVSLNESFGKTEIIHIENNPNKILTKAPAKSIKSEKSIVEMQYNPGDLLKLTGKSGVHRTVFMLTPTSNQNVNFNFIACTDDEGNSYAIVEIGSQWWMAENLNSGTFVPITSPQVFGTKFCMDINGQEDPDCPMGGLYEWANLMQGSSPCNGTGAPPNDPCPTPVKGLCPTGWHIPSHYEWTTLERNSGSNPGAFPYDLTTISLLGTDEGGNLKETCTSYWWDPNAGATNSTGFSGLPGGDTWNGVYEDFGQSAYFWTSTEPLFFAWVHALNYSLTVVGRSSYAVESGFSVRCVKD